MQFIIEESDYFDGVIVTRGRYNTLREAIKAFDDMVQDVSNEFTDLSLIVKSDLELVQMTILKEQL